MNITEALVRNPLMWVVMQPKYWVGPSFLHSFITFMCWDGVALVVFVGILAVGLRFYHPWKALFGALCIPIASAIMQAVLGWSFVEYVCTYVMMGFFIVLLLLPQYATST